MDTATLQLPRELKGLTMTPLEFVEFIANGNADQFVVEHGFLALKQRAVSVLELYEEAQKEAWQMQQALTSHKLQSSDVQNYQDEYYSQYVETSSDVL